MNLHGACVLQGIDPSSLPADPAAARAAVGNSIDKEAHAFVLRHYLLYLKRACALPHLPPQQARVPFPGYGSFSKALLHLPAARAAIEVTVPTILDGDTLTAALPGIDLDTSHDDDDPVIDWSILQPQIDKQRERWALRATTLTKEMEATAQWDCSSLPLPPSFPSLTHANPLDGCEFIRAVPAVVSAATLSVRVAALRTYLALRSPARSEAVKQIRIRAAAFDSRARATAMPTSVSPTRQQWLEGQLQHLSTASSTPAGELRRRQIQHLVRSGSPPTPSAAIPATTPVSLRHPWAGFSRLLVLAAIGEEFFSSIAAPMLPSVHRWSISGDAPIVRIPDCSPADILSVRISCSPRNPLAPVAEVFATTAAVIATQRPLVVAFVTPIAIWSSTQVNAGCSVKIFIDGLAGLDYDIKHISKPFGGNMISILTPSEVGSRLAFKEAFDFSESVELPAGPSVEQCIQQYLRPRHTFRVTNLEQVWPRAHRLRFAAWKADELKRAESLRNGDKVSTPQVLVLDEDDLCPEARGIVWDLRAYWKALKYGKDDPSLIIPLCNSDALDTPFNHEAIRALTGFQRSPFPDLQTVHDLQYGFDNTAEPPKHTCLASNWPLSYQFYEIGNKDIETYLVSGFVE